MSNASHVTSDVPEILQVYSTTETLSSGDCVVYSVFCVLCSVEVIVCSRVISRWCMCPMLVIISV